MGFEQFAGNERIIGTLQQMLAAGRLPHAILLEGEEGLGKRTLAKIIATGAVCRGENPPCDSCRECHLATIGNHPDIAFIRREDDNKFIKVEAVRKVVEAAYIKPSQAERKVFIFEEAHRMNEEAQNALLKTLEEPPPSVVIILLAESAASMLPTIVSRCTVFSLSAPPRSEALEVMKRLGYDTDRAAALLDSAAGNIGRAVTQDKGKKCKVDPDEFIRLIAQNDSYAALMLLKKLEKDRPGTLLFFEQVHTALLAARKAEALGKGYIGMTEDYMKHMTEAVEKAAESCNKNGNMTLIFHTLCYELR